MSQPIGREQLPNMKVREIAERIQEIMEHFEATIRSRQAEQEKHSEAHVAAMLLRVLSTISVSMEQLRDDEANAFLDLLVEWLTETRQAEGTKEKINDLNAKMWSSTIELMLYDANGELPWMKY